MSLTPEGQLGQGKCEEKAQQQELGTVANPVEQVESHNLEGPRRINRGRNPGLQLAGQGRTRTEQDQQAAGTTLGLDQPFTIHHSPTHIAHHPTTDHGRTKNERTNERTKRKHTQDGGPGWPCTLRRRCYTVPALMRGASGNFLGGQCVGWEGFARVASWWFVKKGDRGGQLKSISHHRLAHFPVLFTTISVCSYWICIFGTDCAYLLLCMVHTQTHTYILRYLTC